METTQNGRAKIASATTKRKMDTLFRVFLALVLVLSLMPQQMAFASQEPTVPTQNEAPKGGDEQGAIAADDSEDAEEAAEEGGNAAEPTDEATEATEGTAAEDTDEAGEAAATSEEGSTSAPLQMQGPAVPATPRLDSASSAESEMGALEEASTLDAGEILPQAKPVVNAVAGAKVTNLNFQQWMIIDSITKTPTSVTMTYTCQGTAGLYSATPAPMIQISQPSVSYEQHELLNPPGSPWAHNPKVLSSSSGITRSVTFTGLTPNTVSYIFIVSSNPFPGYDQWGEALLDLTYYSENFVLRTPQAVTVNFDGNGGGTPSFASQVYTSDQPFGTLPTVTPNVGTEFDGWYTFPNAGVKVDASTIVDTVFSGTTGTLYARYKANTNYVAFDSNGGSSSHATLTRKATQALGSLPTPTRANHAFKGWFTAPTGGTQASTTSTPIGLDGTLVDGATITLYAQWERLYSLTYHANGGSGGPGFETLPVTPSHLLKQTPKPTHAPDSGKDVVFVGWTLAQDGHIYAKNEAPPATVTHVNFTTGMVVFAVWGYDENGNSIPDVNETTHNVIYDINGGTTLSGPATETDILPGTHTLATSPIPTHGPSGVHNVVFIGWTETQDTHIYTKGDTMPTTVNSVAITNADKTVWAVWGVDENNNNIPDVKETKYTLDYHVNGGNAGSEPPDHTNILPNTNVTLVTSPAPTHGPQGGENVVFIGWTETQDTHIYTKTDTAPTTVASITITSANKTAFAVWGVDENKNNIPDVNEPKYTLEYDVNGGVAGSGPLTQNNLLSGPHTLAVTPTPTHAPQGLTPVVFVGWTAAQDTHVYTKADLAPTMISAVNISANTKVWAVWGLDENGNNIPDVLESTYNLEYDVNGGIAGTGPSTETGLLSGPRALATTPVPTHGQAGGEDVVFVGWTAAQDTHLYTKTDTAPTTITSVTLSANTKVWAVWGIDENKNNIPDVNETTYTVDYDTNGGHANGPAQETDVLAGPHVLDPTVPTHNPVSGEVVLFIGWTETQDTHIYTQLDTAPTTVSAITVTGNTTVYAVWGEDKNLNNIPDVLENPYKVEYNLNGGIAGSGPMPETGVPIGMHTLATTPVPLHASIGGVNVAFIGWTAAQDTTIYTKTHTPPTTIGSVNIVASDVEVYAVWGLDENKNNIPDVLEGTFTVTYDANGGAVASVPTPEVGILAGPHTLATAPIPTHGTYLGKAVVFIGWTETQDTHIYSKNETAPTTVSAITVASNTTVWAVWGLDENGNNIPDVKEPKYKVTYDVNGGIAGSGPTPETNILTSTLVTLATSPVPTHAPDSGEDVVFVGWSAAADNHIYAKTDLVPPMLVNVTVTADDTVYAVWGYDTNKNNTPDVLETKYTVDYLVNGGDAGTGPVQEIDILAGPHVLATAPVPTHGLVVGVPVVFIGWTAAQDTTIYAVGDPAPTTLNAITVSGNTQVWAVWGFDSNGNTIPDVLETHYKVEYDLNGGIGGTGPATENKILAGSNHALATTPVPTHVQAAGVDVLFIGWTETPASSIFAKGDTAPTTVGNVTVNADRKVYAAWGYDTNGDTIPDVLQTWRTVTECHVDRVGVPVAANTSVSVVDTAAYTGTNIQTVAGKVFAGDEYAAPSPSARSVVTSGVAPSIASVTADVSVYYVYANDNGGGQTPGIGGGGTTPDGVEDVNVDRRWVFISGGAYVAVGGTSTDTQIVNIGDGFAMSETDAPNPTIPAGYAYEGFLTDQDPISATPAAGVPAITASVADGDRTVYYVYSAIPHTVAYHLVDRSNNAVGAIAAPSAQVGLGLGASFGLVAAPNGAPDNKVYVGWKQGIAGALKTGPITGTVTGNMDIYLVYGQDKVDSAGKNTVGGGGPDGIEDVDFALNHFDQLGMAAVNGASKYDKTISWNVGQKYSAKPASISGYVYAGSFVNTAGATVKAAEVSVTPRLADHGASISVLYSKQHAVTVAHVEETGTAISGYDYTHTVTHGDDWNVKSTAIAGYDYKGYKVNGAAVQSGEPSVAAVSAATAVELVYAVSATPPLPPTIDPPTTPTKPTAPTTDLGNYNFIKKPNVTNVGAGETVHYTFSGFGNGWGVPIERYTIADRPDMGLDFVSAQLPAFVNGAGVKYDVVIFTNQRDDIVLHSDVSAGNPFAFSAPGLAAGEYITAISLEFGTVPAGFAVGDTFTMTFKVWDNPPAKSLNNVGVLYYKVGNEFKEFVTGDSGMVTLGGWFGGLPKTGDTLSLVVLLLVATAVATTTITTTRRKRPNK